MKRTSTLRTSALILIFGWILTSSLMSQQVGIGEAQKKEQQDPRIKTLKMDSIPLTIFPRRREFTEEEKKAQELYSEGIKKGNEGNYEGAIEDLTQSIELVKNGNTYMKRAYAYMLTGRFPLAIQDFTEVQNLMPEKHAAIFGMAVARFEIRDYASAEADLKRYLEVVKNNPDAYNYMAAVCFLRQDFQCALQSYSDVIRCDSAYPDAYANRGMIRHYLRDYKGALEDLDIAVGLDPADKKIYNNRAASKMMLKEYQAALEDFTHAIELDSTYADALNNRGRVRFYLGDKEGACSDWHKALSYGLEDSRDLIIKNCN